MKKKYGILLSIIIALSIILIITLIFKNRGYFIPKLEPIKTAINEISITKEGSEPIIIKNMGEEWLINDKYKAEKSLIDNITNTISTLQARELVSRGNEEALNKYKLASNEKINVKAFDSNGKELKNFTLGMKASLNYQVYGQIKNNKNVYLLEASQNPKDMLDKTINDLRNKTIISANEDELDRFSIYTKNTNYTFEKVITSSNTQYWQANNNIKINNDTISKNINYLINIKAQGFLNDNSKETATLYKVDFNFTNKNIVWTLYNKTEDNLYEISLNNDSSRYYISETTATNIINTLNRMIEGK